ncbi:MAG: HD domain-containing protein [Firmicutes bacterium]|nr:HD domain-containing protein [Bacillota bacterium]
MAQTLTLDLAKQIVAQHIDDDHLLAHCLAVSAAMAGMAAHFGEDAEHWQAVGYLHDVDYQKYPQEHLQHTEELLAPYDVPAEDLRAVLSHGYGICTQVEPQTLMEKSLFTVDELSGIVQAAARLRPGGLSDMEVKSVLKKFKDKRFAAGCDRQVILQGCQMLEMELSDVLQCVLDGMKPCAQALGL